MTFFKVHREELEWGGKTLTLETGRIARQADGAVLATYGQTSVLATAVGVKTMREGQDFFPLSVHYQERFYAAGRIPGGFFKREGRPSEKETLVSRLIDRPIRPLFPKGFMNEVQVTCTVLSHDMENDPDVVAMVAASAALAVSGLPFFGPVAGARVTYKDGKYILNPTKAEMEGTDLDLVVAGTDEGVLMVESEAKELSEQTMLDAVLFGHDACQPVIKAIQKLAKSVGKDAWELPAPCPEKAKLTKAVEKDFGNSLTEAYAEPQKQLRQEKIAAIKNQAVEALADEDAGVNGGMISGAFKEVEQNVVRQKIFDTGTRIDGRDTKTVRPIDVSVGVVPRAHGSALFTRGETQALVISTLGTGQDEQLIDAIEGEYKQNFLLHYNFPPYSVGEAGRVGSPGRREIGHGKLAWCSLNPLMPQGESFPYTVRVVSEITESNGSSSMATVCGSSLALMDAGVSLERPVAGIAMGLIQEGKKFAVLSDILGDEDHLGDMDFKVAGTEKGVTALQMDIKVTSITKEIMEVALNQANDGRQHILGEMARGLDHSRTGVSEFAPKMESLSVPKEKIREIIGTGGKVIREICELSGATVDIDDEGRIKVSAVEQSAIDDALARIENIVAEPELNKVYRGKVVKIMEFGAFVNFMGGRDGLVHISELKEERVNQVTDVVNDGQEVYVQLVGFDNRGKVKLSMKNVDQETGSLA
ncbi:polyribonucleotide nucleotidyltransferase [Alphaproteobacteria bacterium]|nr:polyribonucleotide nucleotidyltransferase [Alphaproteobacteria bacterium]